MGKISKKIAKHKARRLEHDDRFYNTMYYDINNIISDYSNNDKTTNAKPHHNDNENSKTQ